jgi:hypothetical protein
MKHRVRLLPAVVMTFAFPWNGWSGTEAAADVVSSSNGVRIFAEFDIEKYSLPRGTASVQPPDEEALPSPRRPYGFGFFAGGSCNHGYSILGGGGGGEAFPHPRLGIGGEGGYYQFSDDVTFGLYDFRVSFHFGESSPTARVDPFLSVSPGMYTSEDQGGFALGFGGGANFWFTDRVGFHADLLLAALGTEEGIFLARVGVAFR